MGNALQSDHVFSLRTQHGTMLAAEPASARLIHVRPDDDAPRVLLYRVAPRMALLARADAGGIVLPGASPSASAIPISVCLLDEACDGATLRVPESTILTALPDGTVAGDRQLAGSWERFVLAPETGDRGLALAARLEADGQTGQVAPELEACLAAACAPERRREIIRTLSRRADWHRVFSSARLALSDGQPRSEWHMRAHLRFGIDAHGWVIGDHSYGAPDIIDGEHAALSIGSYCSVARDVRIVVSNHLVGSPTTYPFVTLRRFWPSAPDDARDHTTEGVTIGSDVWIGAGATILPGARIGDGAIVGAEAVIAGIVAPYAVVVGNPARVVRRRFDDATIARLLALRWWDLPDHVVDRLIPHLVGERMDAFLEAAEAARDHLARAGNTQ